MMEAGIPAVYVSGFAGNGRHAWSKVKLDGQWYNVDVTWNDYGGGRRYFARSDAFMLRDHQPGDDFEYPSAPSDFTISK